MILFRYHGQDYLIRSFLYNIHAIADEAVDLYHISLSVNVQL